ncbi:hypothetical protein G7070_04210 [Propioniciclava coleopterorum]|uniref:Uncharacterized protein n=1 Tax=Propioniciclava coleopterorum TaxID=2714937 RepID=A0A6G7Y4I3_9ACTN|nr:DsrE family protein [Propioniciclava coleopterorum]QIK71619.1 hypothetical protein G7070_04210 [Propioniciclava coleopterorum]
MTGSNPPAGDGVVLQAAGPDEALALSALQSAANLLAEIGPSPVEIVVQSGAVAGLVADHPQAGRLAEKLATLPTVTVLACRNALRAHHVDEDALAPGVGVVPAGIARVVERQRDGWAYVRVG